MWAEHPFVAVTFCNKSWISLYHCDLNCNGILNNDAKVMQQARMMRYNTHFVEKLILDADDRANGEYFRCLAIRSLFGFENRPNSEAERDYPLAYGLIVYKNLVQVLFMLSSFYRPQNEYCIAVSGGAEPMFKLIMGEVDQCFSNIRVLYLAGVDIPLKTNLEMVEILKQWNDTVNAEITWFQPKRIRSKRVSGSYRL
ncbi:Core-2/I-Branching enzyme [Ancylostoma caninum]|uniref:Core-2/I-Branching enzyme n=1 Tax=Ancylostoma caninum TaxID=29170 RepID=A0A368FHE5_ANCCA|nr:Core-2/I-Branching enzyme [Ancylostoma caninum]